MLRVHHSDLTGRHAEERRVEPRHVIDETSPTSHDLAWRTGVVVEEFVGIPSVAGHLGDGVAALAQHVPEFVRIRGTRKTRRVADDGEARGWFVRMCGGFHAPFVL